MPCSFYGWILLYRHLVHSYMLGHRHTYVFSFLLGLYLDWSLWLVLAVCLTFLRNYQCFTAALHESSHIWRGVWMLVAFWLFHVDILLHVTLLGFSFNGKNYSFYFKKKSTNSRNYLNGLSEFTHLCSSFVFHLIPCWTISLDDS